MWLTYIYLLSFRLEMKVLHYLYGFVRESISISQYDMIQSSMKLNELRTTCSYYTYGGSNFYPKMLAEMKLVFKFQ